MLSQRAVPDFAGAALCNNLRAAGIHFKLTCLHQEPARSLPYCQSFAVSCAVWCGFPVNLPFSCHTVKVSAVSSALRHTFTSFPLFSCRTVKVSPDSLTLRPETAKISGNFTVLSKFCLILLQYGKNCKSVCDMQHGAGEESPCGELPAACSERLAGIFASRVAAISIC